MTDSGDRWSRLSEYDIDPRGLEWSWVVDWAVASIVTGFVYTLAGAAVNAEWESMHEVPSFFSPVHAAIVSGGVYSVSVGMLGVLVAKRYGYGKIVGVGLATFASTFPFLVWGWINLPGEQRTNMWTALRLSEEFQQLIIVALVLSVVVMGIFLGFGVAVYSTLRNRASAGVAE